MAKRLRKMRIDAVGVVDQGANQEAMIVIAKRAAPADEEAAEGEGPPCPDCGGDHTKAEHAAAMKSKKMPATKSAGTAPITKEELVIDMKETPPPVAEVPVVKEKPSPADVTAARKDYEAVQTELAKARDQLQKQLDEANKELQDSRAEVVKIHKARRRESFIKRVQELDSLPGLSADDFGELLDDIEKALGDKRFVKLNNLLESWNAVISKSKLFTEVGTDSNQFGFTGPEGQLDILAKELVAKDPKLNYHQAYKRVLETPEGKAIYKRHLTEVRSRKES